MAPSASGRRTEWRVKRKRSARSQGVVIHSLTIGRARPYDTLDAVAGAAKGGADMSYIEREALLEQLKRCGAICDFGEHLIKIAPAADVAPVQHGRWEECDYVDPCIHGFGTIRHANAGLKCTNCVNVFKKELLWKDNYCPNCGARMDGDGNG